jgi:hypothetical protein
MSVIDEIGNQIPNVEIDTVVLEPNRVVVYLHIDEYVYRNGIGTWITREDYTSLLNIRIEQKATRNGESSTEVIGQLPASQYRLSLDYITDPARRERIQEIPYRMVIEDFNYDGIEDLTFSAYTEISEQDLSDQINFSAVGFNGIVGTKNPVEVMKNAQIISRDVGYFLGDAFYTGPKTQLENGRWVTGTEQNEESEFLTVRNIPNIRVSDFRDIQDLGQQLNLARTPTFEEADPSESSAYFSNLFSTRDKDDNLRFVFAFDYKDYYSDASLYGKLFDEMSNRLQDRVLVNSSISSLVLSRKRVDAGFSNEIEDKIIMSGEPSGDRFRDVSAPYGALKEEELSFQRGTLFTRSFSGTDKDFKNINTGKYRYIAEMTIDDGMYKFLTFQETDLDNSQKLLEEYLNEISLPANYDSASDTYKEEFIVKLNEKYEFQNLPYIRALISLTENISFLTPNLTREQVKKTINTLRFMLSPRTGTKAGVEDANRYLGQILSEIRSIKRLVDQDNVETYKNDSRGGSVYTIKRMFTETFSAANSFRSGVAFLSPTEIVELDAATGLKTVEGLDFEARIEDESIKFFGSKDATFQLNVGRRGITTSAKESSFGYLTPTTVRLGEKTYVVHGSKNTSPSGDTTVVSLSTEGEEALREVMAGLTKPLISGLSVDTLDITPESDPDFSPVSNIDEPKVNDQAKDAINNFNNSISSHSLDYMNPITTANVQGIDSASPVEKSSRTAEEEKIKIDNMSSMARYTDVNTPSMENTKVSAEDLNRDSSALTTTTLSTGDTLLITALNGSSQNLTVSDFAGIPNHFKALFTSSTSLGDAFSKIVADIENGFNERYNLLLGSMVRIKVLAGFAKSPFNRRTVIKAPVFVPLTYEFYRQNAGKNLLCKLEPYENSKIGFTRSNDANIYNEYFILKSPILSTIYGDDTRNSLQADLALANNLQDLLKIYEAYGIDPGDVGADDDAAGSTDADTCAAVSDEKVVQNTYGRVK